MSQLLINARRTVPCFRRLAVALFGMMALAAFGSVLWAQTINPTPPYAWTLKSGLSTVERDETLRVLITDVAKSAAGLAVMVRFFDEKCELEDESEGMILPGVPLMAEFRNSGPGRMMVRFEIDLSRLAFAPAGRLGSAADRGGVGRGPRSLGRHRDPARWPARRS